MKHGFTIVEHKDGKHHVVTAGANGETLEHSEDLEDYGTAISHIAAMRRAAAVPGHHSIPYDPGDGPST